MTRAWSVAFVALLACSHASPPPRLAETPSALSGWWELDDNDAAGLYGGAALRVGGETYLVYRTIPAFQICHATLEQSRVTFVGCGQDTSATSVGDELEFADGFHARRVSPEGAAELESIIASVRATCERARGCYRAAKPLLDLPDESSTFGPLLRSDACENIVTNVSSDLHEANKAVPAACAR